MELINNFVAGNLGNTALFYDITGTTGADAYSKNGNIGYADVDAVRISIASLNSINTIQTLNAGDAITPFVEYKCTLGGGVVDSKSVSLGNVYTFVQSGLTVPNGTTLESTGRYTPNTIWLPTAAQVPLTLSLAELNQSGNTYMEDSLYITDYSIYDNIQSGTTAAANGAEYICVSGTTTYNGSTYRAGEIFVAVDTTNISTTGTYAKGYASTTSYFVVTYRMLKDIFEILIASQDERVNQEVYAIRMQLEALSFSAQTKNVSFIYASKVLELLQSKVTYLMATT